jgi:hypothetical protein
MKQTILKVINITRNGIRRGKVEASSCPVARAMVSAGIKRPRVDSSTIAGEYKGRNFFIKTPKDVSSWIKKFDNGSNWTNPNPNRKVNPFSFTLKFNYE